MHVGDLDGSAASAPRNRWSATVTILVHDVNENPVSGATVSGNWGGGANGSGSCVTNEAGQCSITKNNLKNNVASVTFMVSNITLGSNTYDSGANHDPDGDSNGTLITINRP